MSDPLPSLDQQPLISLCLIVGNVEEYIRRCLSSFSGFADEIVVVRAIGFQNADATLEIAEKEFGARCFEYRNAPEHFRWPHVDNFARARQMSFDQARGEWCFWCDTDDVLLPGSAAIIRELAERGGYPGFIFPYDIFGRGVTVPRERLVMKSAGKWHFPVHECFRFHIESELASDTRVVVQHLPKPSKTGSSERNLRILQSIPQAERTPGILYHLHKELLSADRKKDAVDTAIEALKHPDLGTPERYELLIDMARMVKEPNAAHQYLIQAYAADPCRREALGMLATTAIDFDRPTAALAFARQMMATERPQAWSWNDRDAAYGWIGYDIYQQALRANGRFADAEGVRRKMLEQSGGPVISLVHATRGRPFEASRARKMWLDLAENPEAVEHLFVIDADDVASGPLRRFHNLIVEPRGCVHAWNQGAHCTRGEILVQMSDDWVPPAKWDTLILERLRAGVEKEGDEGVEASFGGGSAVLAVSDGHRADRLLCLAIMTRGRLLEQNGHWFHPEFFGVFSDNWFTDCAYRDGVVIEARDLVFEHRHPAFDNAVAVDETYARQNDSARYREGEAIYRRLTEQAKLGVIDFTQIPGWFDFLPLYESVAQSEAKVVVEVGVWMGKSLCYLAQALQRRGWKGQIFAVDSWDGRGLADAATSNVQRPTFNVQGSAADPLAAFCENMAQAEVLHSIEVVKAVSWEAAAQFAREGCDFVFIDAGHDFDSVRRDIEAWWPKIAPGGVLAGHDFPEAEVNRAVREFFPTGVQQVGRCWVVTKEPRDLTAADAAGAATRQGNHGGHGEHGGGRRRNFMTTTKQPVFHAGFENGVQVIRSQGFLEKR